MSIANTKHANTAAHVRPDSPFRSLQLGIRAGGAQPCLHRKRCGG